MAPVTAALGRWHLEMHIESGNRPPPKNPRDPQASMTLAADTATNHALGAPTKQFAATITVPGYSRPSRRGRPGQAASWWPVPGDSIVVQFTQGAQSRGEMQLRARLNGNSLGGEVWYVSSETGSNFQLGTFTGSRSR